MPRWIREQSLTLFFGLIFLAALVGQSIVGHEDYNNEQQAHDSPPISYGRYVLSSSFGRAMLENWQSEFLAVGTMVIFTVYLRQRGSPESKPVGSPHDETSATG